MESGESFGEHGTTCRVPRGAEIVMNNLKMILKIFSDPDSPEIGDWSLKCADFSLGHGGPEKSVSRACCDPVMAQFL